MPREEKNVRRKACALGPFGVPVEPHLLYVFADSWVQKAAQGLTGANRFPDRRRRGWLMQVGQQVNRGSRQHQISRGSLFSEGSSHLRPRPQSLRKCIRDIRQGISRPARNNKFTLAKQCFRLMPLRNFAKRIHSNQEK